MFTATRRIAALALALTVAASGQRLETVILLPDSLSALTELTFARLTDSTNRFWVGGLTGRACGVISADLRQRTGRTTTLSGSRYGNAFLYNPLCDKVYFSSAAQESVDVIDATTGERCAVLHVGRDPHGLALSTVRNKVYVTNYADESVTVLDGEADTVITTLWVGRGPQYPCYNEAADRIYTSNYSGQSVAVIDCSTDHLVTSVAIGADVRPLIFSPSANKVYVGHAWDSTVTVIEAAGNTICARIRVGSTHFQWPQRFCLNPSGGKIYCALRYDEIAVIDEEGDSVRGYIAVPGGAGGLAANPRLNQLFCINPDSGCISVIDCSTDSVVETFAVEVGANSVTFDTAGRVGAVVSPATDEVLLFDPDSNRVHTRLKYGWSVPGVLCTDSAGERLWCADEERLSVVRVDPVAGVPVCTIPVGAGPAALLHVPSHAKLYCANQDAGTITVIDADRDSVRATLAPGAKPVAVAWDPVDEYVYCALNGCDTVAVIDANLDSIVARVLVGLHPAALAWSPAGNKVYVANYAGASVSVIDCATNRRVRNLPAGGGATALLRNPVTGRIFCANEGSNTVTVYDEDTDSLVAIASVATSPHRLLFDPDRGTVFCACRGSDRVMALDGMTGAVLAEIVTLPSPWALSYSPVNDRVYCAHLDRWRVTFIDAARLRLDGELYVGEWPQAMARSETAGRTFVSCGRASGLWVISDLPVGLVDQGRPMARFRPTRLVADGVLVMGPGDHGSLLDAAGRHVCELVPGDNDVRWLGPGVYFLSRPDAGRAERVLLVHQEPRCE